MAAQVAAVELLMSKANCDPHVALAVTEAFTLMLTEAQVITAPMLSARVKELDHKIDVVEKRLESQILVSEARLEKLIIATNEGTQLELQKVRTEIKSDKAEMMRWVLLTMLGAVAMQAGVTAVVNMLR